MDEFHFIGRVRRKRVHTTFWGFLKEIRFVLSTGAPENGMHPKEAPNVVRTRRA